MAATDADWTFLTDHAHVLVGLARDPYASVATLARQTGIEHAHAERILADLVEEGYAQEQRERGQVVRRVVVRGMPLRHPVEAHHPVGRLLDAVESPAELLERRTRGGD